MYLKGMLLAFSADVLDSNYWNVKNCAKSHDKLESTGDVKQLPQSSSSLKIFTYCILYGLSWDCLLNIILFRFKGILESHRNCVSLTC